ncbi:helix-turn-helix domain-containing protein [Thiosulfativibrio zosterae]|uniref:HTH cro/C1-type domain-containing protein n=1 Tax=Thiosulfativibrio zosterae TaxID=2675053 RepID=A0A6F8PQA9_9GAMM|nr:helix-turn-helix transcriptional regulator [Thiosulfativibrio zosterae]BBP44295.1 hypothetical protein THMIRHAT_20410 [Thiosulfativibrio zosterae]
MSSIYDGYQEFFDFVEHLRSQEIPSDEALEQDVERFLNGISQYGSFPDSDASKRFAEEVSFGLMTKSCRNLLNQSQQEFAKNVGLSKPTIARLETFETKPNSEMTERIIGYLNSEGLTISISGSEYQLSISPSVFIKSYLSMLKTSKRRSDRKVKE